MDDFVNKYRIKHIRVSREYDRIDYGYNYNTPSVSYATNREEYVEMEISRSGFEELVNIDRKFARLMEKEGGEAYLRRHHPAVAEAYDKYKMLLELYK